MQMPPSPTGAFAQRGNWPQRTLPLEHLLEDARRLLRQGLAIEPDDTVAHLDPIAGTGHDQPLDEIGLRDRMTKYHDVAALGLRAEDAPRKGAQPERAGILRIAIGHLVDEQEVADQQRLLHRPRGIQNG
jgi:hypothetical protein